MRCLSEQSQHEKSSIRDRVYHLQSLLDIISQDTHSTFYHLPYSYLNYKSEPKLKLKGKNYNSCTHALASGIEKTEPFQSKIRELGQSTGSLYGAMLGNNTSQRHATADVEFTYITYTPLPKSLLLEGDTTTVTQTLGSKGQNTAHES